MPLLTVSQVSCTDTTGKHRAPVEEACVKYQGKLLSVQGSVALGRSPPRAHAHGQICHGPFGPGRWIGETRAKARR